MEESTQDAAAILILPLLLSHPRLAYEDAKDGLLLWSQTALPIPFPFMMCPNVTVALDVIHLLTWPFKPLLTHVPKLSPAGNYVLISGPLCDYPMGAETCNELLKDNHIASQEAFYLLSICNHPNPVFLLGYVAGCMANNIPMIFLLIALYLPILPLSLLSRRYYGVHGACQGMVRKPDKALSFDKTMIGSVKVMVGIDGYIVLFSILACSLRTLLKDYNVSQAVLLDVVEITTGIQSLFSYMTGPARTLAIVAMTAFGGVSGTLQTNSVLLENAKKAGLSIRHYILWKMLHNAVSCLIPALLLAAFPQVSGR